jgi:hypothetical protein
MDRADLQTAPNLSPLHCDGWRAWRATTRLAAVVRHGLLHRIAAGLRRRRRAL